MFGVRGNSIIGFRFLYFETSSGDECSWLQVDLQIRNPESEPDQQANVVFFSLLAAALYSG